MVYFHLLLTAFQSLYGYFTKKNWFDIYYIWGSFVILFHWTFLNGECILTYLSKRKRNPSYIAGEDTKRGDFHHYFKGTPKMVEIITTGILILTLISIYKVFKRNSYPTWISMYFILVFLIYFYGMYLFKHHNVNPSFQLFQNIIKYLLILWALLFIFYY
jgi:hypothetical protein